MISPRRPTRVGQLPVLVAVAWVERAGVTAAHRDDHVGLLDGTLLEEFGVSFETSMPTSAITSRAMGLTSSAGLLPADSGGSRRQGPGPLPAWLALLP